MESPRFKKSSWYRLARFAVELARVRKKKSKKSTAQSRSI